MFENKMNEYKDRIDKIIKEKRAIEKTHYDTLRKYRDQQSDINHIKWMMREKGRLERAEERRKRLEEEKEDEGEIVHYLDEIELCQHLMDYCNSLKPRGSAQEEAKKEKTTDSALEAQFKGMELSKKEDEEWVVNPKKGKGKKGKKQNKQQEQKPAQNALNHGLEVLKYFAEIGLDTPNTTEQLDTTIKALEEKLDYYKKLSDEKKKEILEGKPAESEKKEEKKDEEKEKKEDKEEKQKSPKKNKKKDTTINMSTDNNQEFPSL